MKTLRVFLAALLVLTFPFISHAQIPRTLSYQGVLTDNAGKPRPDGNYTFKFCLFGSNSGGSPIWCEEKTLQVKNGLFSTLLGDKTPFGAAVKFDKQYWLGIQVGNEPELSPRIALTSVGYSFSSLRADTASVSVASLADTTWRHSGFDIYRPNGNVGIGTISPTEKLDIQDGRLRVANTQIYDNEINRYGDDALLIQYRNAATGGFPAGNTIINRNGGNVGIGTTNPSSKLEILGGPSWTSNNWTKSLKLNPGSVIQFDAASALKFGIGASESGNSLYLFTTTTESNDAPANYKMVMNADGNVGIGTTSPTERLDIQNGGLRVANTRLNDNEINRYGDDALLIQYRNAATGGFPAGNTILNANGGNVGIGTTSPTTKLHVEGTTTTKVLAITGGSDLAEPFEISESQAIPKGALVIIDEENPGQLKLSHQAYDKRVAGVVSGAGGINPGLTLTQEGVMEGGQNVALSGRVYALATAANGPIKPGDLLTTSDMPGHAMKATDAARSHGTIIGKAMSSLEKGEGLVLVLVNLQ